MEKKKKQGLVSRYAKAYLSLLAIVGFFAGISLSKGAGWKPLLIPLPVFLLLFVGITYQLIKDVRSRERKESTDEL